MKSMRVIGQPGHPKLKRLRQRLKLRDANQDELNTNNSKKKKHKSSHEEGHAVKIDKKRKKQQEHFKRASPMKLVRLYKKMNKDQCKLIKYVGFGSMLDIKCSKLQPDLCKFLMDSFNPDSCQLEFPGRGNIPITDEAVHRVLGIPMGRNSVRHELDYDAISFMLDMFGIENGTQPTLTHVKNKLAAMKSANETYLRMWMILAVCSVIAPTTNTKVSPRCYPSLVDTTKNADLNWCRYVIDILIKAAKDKDKKNIFKASLPFLMTIYVDSLEVKHMQVTNSGTLISVWTNQMVRSVVAADTARDGSFGMLPEMARYIFAVQEMSVGFEGLVAKFLRTVSHNQLTLDDSADQQTTHSTSRHCRRSVRFHRRMLVHVC